MKGVLICGGSGTRLRPLTEITNKSLLPVYDRPLVEFPLQTLIDAGIKDIIVISGNEHIDQMASYLGSDKKRGCTFSYRVQEKANGIAQALGLAEEFADGGSICAILGDNMYFDNLSTTIRAFKSGGHVFLKEVRDPERFGIASLDTLACGRATRDDKTVHIESIEEKPTQPKSHFAVTGCYLYDHRCFEVIRNLKPSARGEFEITDVSKWYLEHGELTATILQDEWIDAGTFESLYRAATVVRERRES